MVMASTAAGQSTSESIEKSKVDMSPQTVESGLQPERRQSKRHQTDLAGFIGTDVWMVGKYER